MKVKICGITRYEDAVNAFALGADAIGFIFAESKRKIDIQTCKSITHKLPAFCFTVGVFKNNSREEIKRAIRDCGLSAAQFHGDEDEDFCKSFSIPYIKGFSIRGEQDIEKINEFPGTLNILVDGSIPGSGKMFDHELLKFIPHGKKVILAGGLNPDNVGEAVKKARIYAVDVSSGVEVKPGIKDRNKVKSFIKTAKGILK